MSTRSPYAPEPPDSTEAAIRQRTARLLQISRQILGMDFTAADQGTLPELSQLILQRGRILDELQGLRLDQLPPSAQPEVLAELQACQALEGEIEARLSAHRDTLGEQLKQLKDNRGLLNKYRATARDTSGTRNEQA